MKFYDRETELKILERTRELSAEHGMLTVITGRRRIGKTTLIMMSEERRDFLYLFVTRSNEAFLCEQLTENAKKQLGLTIYDTRNFRDLFEQLLKHGEENDFTFVLDEFQELERINPSIISSIQELWDRYKSKTKTNLIVCGSIYSMMIRIFENEKEPLFGRAASKLNIDPFKPSVLKEILNDHNPNPSPDDLLFLYTVSGGVPKYVELLMDSGSIDMDLMLDQICSPDSPFITDGRDLLVSEFGKDYGTYFSILRLIADGKNTSKEIGEMIGKEPGAYLDNLEREFGLVRRNRPIFSKDNSRDVRWKITDNYLKFYFRFIYSNLSLVELKKYDMLNEKIRSGYPQYSGSVLEDYFKEKIAEEEAVTKIGSHWDKKGHNEIDIIALNDMNMTAVVTEVKRDPKKADLKELQKKAETVNELKGFEVKYRILSLNDL